MTSSNRRIFALLFKSLTHTSTAPGKFKASLDHVSLLLFFPHTYFLPVILPLLKELKEELIIGAVEKEEVMKRWWC